MKDVKVRAKIIKLRGKHRQPLWSSVRQWNIGSPKTQQIRGKKDKMDLIKI